jgi:hypothetical protein
MFSLHYNHLCICSKHLIWQDTNPNNPVVILRFAILYNADRGHSIIRVNKTLDWPGVYCLISHSLPKRQGMTPGYDHVSKCKHTGLIDMKYFLKNDE